MAQPNKRNNRLECIKSSVKFKLLFFLIGTLRLCSARVFLSLLRFVHGALCMSRGVYRQYTQFPVIVQIGGDRDAPS